MGFCASGADKQTSPNPSCDSGLTNIAELLFLISTNYFQSAALWAHGITYTIGGVCERLNISGIERIK
jgi:hypothetical protein